jgi:hypothetical protein
MPRSAVKRSDTTDQFDCATLQLSDQNTNAETMYGMDARTGALLSSVPVPWSTLMYNVEYDSVTDTAYTVMSLLVNSSELIFNILSRHCSQDTLQRCSVLGDSVWSR